MANRELGSFLFMTGTNQPGIAYLVSVYPAISHTFVFREVEALRREGFEVRPVAFRRDEHLDRMTADEKAEAERTFYLKDADVLDILAAHLRVLFRSPVAYFRMRWAAVKLAFASPTPIRKAIAYFAGAGVLLDWMRRNGVSHIHVHLANPAATVAMLAAASRTVTFSMSVHGPDVFYDVSANLLERKVRAATFVRCISHFCQSQLMRIVPFAMWRRFHVVRCGVDVDTYAPRPEPGNIRAELLCVGRLVPAKGQHVLLQACRELVVRGVDFRLTYVGEGPDRESLERATVDMELTDHIEFAGAVGQDAIHEYYNRADVFVLPSFAEGLPIVLMEAMAKTIPCVTTRIAAIPELIEHGVNGLLTAPSDWRGLADALQRLIDDPPLRAALGGKARERVIVDYDNAKNGLGMAEVFRRELGGERND